jgi:hypothetical protein
MSRVLKITFAFGVVCASAIGYYLVRPEPVVAESRNETFVYKPQKGVSERPADAKTLAGRYYRGDGTGYNIYLALNPDGTYEAEWRGCLGTYGEAAGDWKLEGTQIVFTPSKETDMMRSHLRGLDVLKFQGHWIFLSTEKNDREFYDKWGVSTHSCFQNTNSIFRGP